MNIGVIMGGTSSEREISLYTGKEMENNLDKNKYVVIPIVIENKNDIIYKVKNIDFALLALHGKFGEDGTVQGVLETMGIPYSGCGLLSSSLCMDKDITKKIIRAEGIKTADWVMIKEEEQIKFNEINNIGYPIVVKPNCGGSSVATSIVESEKQLEDAVRVAFKYDKEVMIEKYLKGDEITCCILNGKMLPIIAIKPKASFFDYTSKYSDGGAEEFVVQLEEKLQEKVEAMAIKCYNALKCKVYARVDMIIVNGETFVLEINTLPGMTKNSLFPKSAATVGLSFGQLLDNIIESSIKEKR